MPYDDPDASDPMALVGVQLPGSLQDAEASCRVFAEEFASLGADAGRLMTIFRDPFYAGPHHAYLALGEERVLEIVRESAAPWAGVRFRDRDTDPETGARLLPVIDAYPMESEAGDA